MRRWTFLILLASTGCASRRPASVLSPNFFARAPSKVAVLPFDNQSVDLVAPVQLQKMTMDRLRRHGYAPIPIDVVEAKLKEIGITDGGQLPAMSTQKLGETLDVDGLFFGTVEEFLFQDLGFLLRRIVKMRLRLVLASTGETLWDDYGDGATVLGTLKEKEAKKLFAEGMAQKSVENMAHRPLWKESELAVDHVVRKLPPPGAGFNRYPPPKPFEPPPVYAPPEVEKGAAPPADLPEPSESTKR